MDLSELIAYLTAIVEKEGGLKKCAEARGVSYQYLGNAINGHQEPGALILKAFGIVRITRYRMLRP